jgi:hypothetical protein
MKNEIAQLLDAHKTFWRDLNSLSRDITYLITNGYKWTHFEFHNVEDGCFYNSFYGEKNILLFILFDLTVDVPYLQISAFHLVDSENDNEISINFLEENWKKTDPRFYLWDKSNTVTKTTNGFYIVETGLNMIDEYYTFSPKIDLVSIVSNEVVNTDINELIKALLEDSNEKYESAILKFTS